MSDTPRTNACGVRFSTLFAGEDAMWVPSKKAKEIERELNAANERIKRLKEAGEHLRQTSSDKRACDAWDQLIGAKCPTK